MKKSARLLISFSALTLFVTTIAWSASSVSTPSANTNTVGTTAASPSTTTDNENNDTVTLKSQQVTVLPTCQLDAQRTDQMDCTCNRGKLEFTYGNDKLTLKCHVNISPQEANSQKSETNES